ncbi:MAG: ABC transporter substrate-binding protein, partial [Candidatus Saccharimonadales bacterium]
RLRGSQRQVEDIGQQAEKRLEEHLLRPLEKISVVKRFMIAWILLVVLLIGAVVYQNLGLSSYYQVLKNVPGGIYQEGVLGRFTNANPIYAATDADATVSRLIFAGLLKINSDGRPTPDLASGYTVSDNGMTYTVKLKPHLTWQDGQPLTSRDVLFTYQTIQNPDAQSPLFNAWQGITVSAPDTHTIVFNLPNPLADFPYYLTNGIVPRHSLSKIPPEDLRSAAFNTVDPVGAGPFAWGGVQVISGSNPNEEQEQIALTPFAGYSGGQPKLDKFIVDVFADDNQLNSAFASGQLTAMLATVPPPKNIQDGAGVVVHNLLLRAANMVFFKTSSGILADTKVRAALVEGTDTKSIIDSLGYT